jgi:hypothetical protein
MWIHVDIPAHDVSLSENSAKLNGLKGFTFPLKNETLCYVHSDVRLTFMCSCKSFVDWFHGPDSNNLYMTICLIMLSFQLPQLDYHGYEYPRLFTA